MHLHEVLPVWVICHVHLLHTFYWQVKPCCSKCITYNHHKVLFLQYFHMSCALTAYILLAGQALLQQMHHL